MASFKVGQRVRITIPGDGVKPVYGFIPSAHKCGIVVQSCQAPFYRVSVFGVLSPPGMSGWAVHSDNLRPAQPPRTDALIERIKKLEPLREPVIA